MIARNRIWEEMKQAKANILCMQIYTDKRRAGNRWYNLFIAFFSALGALGGIFNFKIPAVTSIIVAFVSIMKSVMPNFLQTEPELAELDKLSDYYNCYLNSLEKIWYNFDHEFINEKDTMSSFFDLKEVECDKQSILNRGIRNIPKKMQDKINAKAEEYINRVYFTKEIEK